ncbi:LamG domain-containing protein, partial [Candidatus Berkelbacteria bacterium]|nr:LamG domain-containing protein [Candidatus Berkelbacteria bacterium]
RELDFHRPELLGIWKKVTAVWLALLLIGMGSLSAIFLGIAQADEPGWSFTNPADYIFDSNLVEVDGGVASLKPIDQLDDSNDALGFGGGSHFDTQWQSNSVELSSLGLINGSGNFTSRVIDAGRALSWQNLKWMPSFPYFKPLLNNGKTESGYASGNISMAGNRLLLHLDEEVGTSITDGSGSGNDAQCSGTSCPTLGLAGRFANSPEFNGTDDKLLVPDSGSLKPTGAFSLSGWFKSSGAGSPVGQIQPVNLDSLEYDTLTGLNPSAIKISNSVIAIAYTGDGSDGFIKTFAIDSAGSILSNIDTLEFDTVAGLEPNITHVANDIYAISYRGPGNDGWLVTIEISTTGDIGSAPIDSLEYDPLDGFESKIVAVDTDTFAIAYRGTGVDGWLVTVDISATGDISSAVVDSLEFDPVEGREPEIIKLDADTFAIAYRGVDTDGWLATMDISSSGIISPLLDTFEFDPVEGREPDIVKVGSDKYAIVYRGPGSDGWLATIGIGSAGTIDTVLTDSFEYDPAQGTEPSITGLSGGIYTIAFTGPGSDGFVSAISIDSAGSIGAIIDSFEHDPTSAVDSELFHIDANIFGIAYAGSGSDGFLTTLDILSSRGIAKRLSYALDATDTEVSAEVGSSKITNPIASGWNHLVLTYDPSLSADQQKLYQNGSLVASATISAPILTDDSVIIGNGFAGQIDEVAFFDRALSADEIEDFYNRGAKRIKFQVRSCNDPACSGESFIGPDGSGATYYSEELNNSSLGLPNLDLLGINSNRYFQYRLFLESDLPVAGPLLNEVEVLPRHYPEYGVITTKQGLPYSELKSISQTLTAGNEGNVRYQLSSDSQTWYGVVDDRWQKVIDDPNQAAQLSEINSLIGDFENVAGLGKLYLRIYLLSDGSEGISLNNVTVDAFVNTGSSVPIVTSQEINTDTSSPEVESELSGLVDQGSDSSAIALELAEARQQLNRLSYRYGVLLALILIFFGGLLIESYLIYRMWQFEHIHHPTKKHHRKRKRRK